ncbi:MAG: LacI family transcriptional regulator [Bifidobacteriaceae bacterium]|nr:LacI family transcriptional regulator [Bifidobacteriaceae bacterium]
MAPSRRHSTIYDVAARAGVSIGTVSKTLNHPSAVAEPTRRRVLDAVQALAFVPKEAAQARARRNCGRIGVFAPFTSYPSFAERLNGVLSALPGNRAEVVVFDVQSAAESSHVLETLPAMRSLDGVIVMSVPISLDVALRLQEGRLPAVFVDVSCPGFPAVATDDELGGRLAGDALLAAGKRRCAFLGHAQVQPAFESPSRRRLEGFQAALAAQGLALAPESVVLTGRSFDDAAAAATRILSGSHPPDGIFAHTDELAAAAHLAAQRLGLNVPEDLGIIGFDDSTLAEALELTTIRQPLRETGRWAFTTLTAMIADPSMVAPSVTLPVTLVRRRSV